MLRCLFKKGSRKASVFTGQGAKDIKWKQCTNILSCADWVFWFLFFKMESVWQQSVFCWLGVQKNPHSRKLGTEEETKGSVCTLRYLLPTAPSFLNSVTDANCPVSALILRRFWGQSYRVTLCRLQEAELHPDTPGYVGVSVVLLHEVAQL